MNGSSAQLGLEAKLWLAADKLRNNMDAAEHKHVVLGLIFLKYISDTFEEHRANPEDPDEYRAENVFWVPQESRWAYLQALAKQPSSGRIVDDAMLAIERDNPHSTALRSLAVLVPPTTNRRCLHPAGSTTYHEALSECQSC